MNVTLLGQTGQSSQEGAVTAAGIPSFPRPVIRCTKWNWTGTASGVYMVRPETVGAVASKKSCFRSSNYPW
jgi:hypothetical protein